MKSNSGTLVGWTRPTSPSGLFVHVRGVINKVIDNIVSRGKVLNYPLKLACGVDIICVHVSMHACECVYLCVVCACV